MFRLFTAYTMLSRIASRACASAIGHFIVRNTVKPVQRRAISYVQPLFQANKQLFDFLKEEIELERGAQKFPGNLPEVKGFQTKFNGANVTLSKSYHDETVTVKFNVNHTVDAEADLENNQESEDKMPQMVSRPSFTIDVAKEGDQILSLHCIYPMGEDAIEDSEGGQGQNDALDMRDVFEIEEVAFHEGEWTDSTYAVSGEVMDGNLYDLLMTALEERGIDDHFSQDLIKLSTAYEHRRYIGFLDQLKGFAEK